MQERVLDCLPLLNGPSSSLQSCLFLAIGQGSSEYEVRLYCFVCFNYQMKNQYFFKRNWSHIWHPSVTSEVTHFIELDWLIQ